jgi:hypothetical protein
VRRGDNNSCALSNECLRRGKTKAATASGHEVDLSRNPRSMRPFWSNDVELRPMVLRRTTNGYHPKSGSEDTFFRSVEIGSKMPHGGIGQ